MNIPAKRVLTAEDYPPHRMNRKKEYFRKPLLPVMNFVRIFVHNHLNFGLW